MRAVVEWAASKQKLEKIIESVIRCEAELREGVASEPTEEEIQQRANDALQATDLLQERSLVSALAFVMPTEDQRPKVYGALQEHASTAIEKAAALAFEEAEHLCVDLQDIFSMQDNTKDSLFQAIGSIEIPTLSTLIASALAPAQLRLLHVTNQISAFQVMFLTALSGSVLLWHGWWSSCMVTPLQHSLFMWYVVDTSVCGVCVLIRLWTMLRVGAILGEVEDPPDVAAEDPVRALRIILDYYLTTGADALVSFDEVMKSCFYALANWVVVFNCIWVLYGTDLVFNMAWQGCMKYGIIVLRIRVVLFHVFLIPILVSVVLFFLGSFLESAGFQKAVLRAADAIDGLLGIGLPIASIVVQSVLVRNKCDMAKLQLRRYELKKMELEIKQREIEQEAQKLGQLQEVTAEELERCIQERDSEAALGEGERMRRRIQSKEVLITKAEHALRRMNQAAMLAGARTGEPAIQSASDTPTGDQP